MISAPIPLRFQGFGEGEGLSGAFFSRPLCGLAYARMARKLIGVNALWQYGEFNKQDLLAVLAKSVHHWMPELCCAIGAPQHSGGVIRSFPEIGPLCGFVVEH